MLVKTIAISSLIVLAASVFVKSTGVEVNEIKGNWKKGQMEILGKQIRTVRQMRKISQSELANQLHISRAQLESIENGSKMPVKEVVFKAENILKTTFVCDATDQAIKS